MNRKVTSRTLASPPTAPPAHDPSEGNLPPSPARLFALAAGLVEMTAADRAWLETHPQLVASQRELQFALSEAEDAIAARPLPATPSSAWHYSI